MADVKFNVDPRFNVDAVLKEIREFKGTFEELIDLIEKYKDRTGKSTNRIETELVTDVKGLPKIKEATKATVSYNKSREETTKQVNKGRKAMEGSLTSLQQTLNREKQLKNAVHSSTAEYKRRTLEIIRLETAVRRAKGIEDGSIAAIRAEGQALQQQLNNLNLTTQARQLLTDSINRNAEALRRAQGIEQGSIGDLRAQQAEQQRLAESLKFGTAEQVRAANAAQTLGNRINSLTPKTLTFIGALNKLATIQAGFQAITAIFGQISGSIDKVVRRLKEVEAFNLALRNIGLSAVQTASAFSQAATTANALGAPIQQVEKAYKRITPALKDIGASAKTTDRFIENLTARTAVLGLTTEESGRLQEAFAQVLAKGKLQAEELTQQISEVDGAFRTQFAQAIGKTSAELQQLASDGAITASVFVQGVNNMSNGVDILKANIESGNATIQQLQNLIQNINLKTLEEIGRSIEPGIRAFLEAGRVVAEFIKNVASSQIGQLLGDAFNQIGGTVKNVLTVITTLGNALVALLSPIAQLLRLFTPLIGVILTFTVALRTATAVTAAYKAVITASVVEQGILATTTNLAAQAIVRFATALKALLALKFKKFIGDLAGSFASFAKILLGAEITAGITGFGTKLGVVKTGAQGVTKAVQLAIPGLTGFAGAAGAAGTSAAAAGTAAGTVGAGGFAAMAAAALPLIATAGLIIGAVALITGGLNSFGTAGKLAGDSMRKLDGELGTLGIKTKTTTSQWSTFITFLKYSFPVITGLVNLFQFLGRQLQRLGFANQTNEIRKTVKSVDAEFKKAGVGGIMDFTGAQNLSGKESLKLINTLGALARSQNEYAAQIKKTIKEKEAQGKLGKEERAILEYELKQAEDRAAIFEIQERKLALLTKEQRKNIQVTGDESTATERSTAALEKKNAAIERATTNLNTKNQKEYNDGLITEGELELRNANIVLQASKTKLAAIEEEARVAAEFQATRAKDVNEQQKLEEELAGKKVKAEAEVAAAQQEFRKAELKRLQEITKQAEELIGIYKDSASAASTSFDTFGGALTGAIDQLRDSLFQEAAIEFSITGDESVFDKAIDTQGKVLDFEYRIGRTKNQIAQQQRQFELELQAIKIQTLKLEAQQRGGPQAAKLVRAYDQQLGIIRQISSLNQVTARAENLQLDYKIRSEQRALNFAREIAGLEPFKVIDERNFDQTFNEFNNFTNSASRALDQFGPLIASSFDQGLSAARSGFQELQEEPKRLTVEQEKFNSALTQGIDELTEAARALASKNYGLKLGEELQKALGGAFDEFNKSLESTPKVVNGIKESTEKVSSAFDSSATAAGALNTQLQTTNTLLEQASRLGGSLPMGGGVRALATGGPVSAGTSYFVNDGGGREAFVDMSGRAQLLPASRNIKWRAPKDGFVLPAPMTDSLIQNSKINAQINAVNNSSIPQASMNASSVGMSSSGNLIKQMGAMMGGNNTQRITNHVTIQSQSPVMDASKIMANVARMKARRGIRQ